MEPRTVVISRLGGRAVAGSNPVSPMLKKPATADFLRSERSQATAVMVQSWSNSRVGATAEASGRVAGEDLGFEQDLEELLVGPALLARCLGGPLEALQHPRRLEL